MKFWSFSRRFSTSTLNLARIQVTPVNSLVDQRLNSTIISELDPDSFVDLKLSVTNNANLNFSTKTQFRADNEGIIDLSKITPSCKSYSDPDIMSIYWLLKPQEDSDTRFWPLQIQNGLECKYEVFQNENLVAETLIYKDYMGPGVQRIEIKEGKIRGTLFLPQGEGPFPAVINLYGGIHKRNVIEDKSAMFASRGIASLSLAFFGVEGLPRSYAE